jgi:hypothetical protein
MQVPHLQHITHRQMEDELASDGSDVRFCWERHDFAQPLHLCRIPDTDGWGRQVRYSPFLLLLPLPSLAPPSFSCSPFLLLLPLSSPHPRDLRGTPASFAALPLLALGSLAFFPSRSLFPLPCSQSLVPCSQSLGPYGSCRNPQIRRVYTAMRLPQSFAFYRVTVCRVPHPGRWSRNAP